MGDQKKAARGRKTRATLSPHVRMAGIEKPSGRKNNSRVMIRGVVTRRKMEDVVEQRGEVLLWLQQVRTRLADMHKNIRQNVDFWVVVAHQDADLPIGDSPYITTLVPVGAAESTTWTTITFKLTKRARESIEKVGDPVSQVFPTNANADARLEEQQSGTRRRHNERMVRCARIDPGNPNSVGFWVEVDDEARTLPLTVPSTPEKPPVVAGAAAAAGAFAPASEQAWAEYVAETRPQDMEEGSIISSPLAPLEVSLFTEE